MFQRFAVIGEWWPRWRCEAVRDIVETVEETPVVEDVVEQTAPEVVEEAPMVAETPAVEEAPVVEEEVIAEAPVEDAPATESTEEEEKA